MPVLEICSVTYLSAGQVNFGRTIGMGLEKDMALEKRHGIGRKGQGAGKRGMARRHAKRGWGKH